MGTTIFLALAALCSSPTIQGVGDSAALLGGQQATAHFALHYRPGSRAGASVDRIAHEVEREYAEILDTLGIRGRVDEREPFHIFLYDSVTEMSRITGTGGTGGFSSGRESHIPWDNDQTRMHELVHIVVAAMESTGDEPRNLFFAEGIANAVLRFVHGIPVHAVAAYERRRGSLPELSTLVGHADFYAFLKENPGLNAYDVAGSFFLHLLETYEPVRVMTYYHGRPIRAALGKPLAVIEKQWHAKLDAFAVRPELATLLSSRRGDGGEFTHVLSVEERLPAEVLGNPREWEQVQAELVPTDALGEWKIDSKSIIVTNPSGADWTIAEVPGRLLGDCVLRVQAKVPDACWGVKVRHGSSARGMVLGQGAFIYSEQGGIAHSREHRLKAGSTLDIVLEVRGGRARLFLDGERALEADVEPGPAPIGLGMVGGRVEFSGFSVRELSGSPGAADGVDGRSRAEEPMHTTTIAFEVELASSYEAAIEMLTAALAAEGFGILTRIDVKETLKKKLDADFRPYSILGACNPPLAHRALSQSGEVGLMLPCNVTVEAREGGGSLVRIGDPAAFMRIGDFAADEVLQGVADEARERLRRVALALAAR